MEWVETTAKTVDEAKERALDQLGVVADEAEFDVLEEPRPGLFGRLRGEARVRARVRPAQVRPKEERRRGRRERPADGASEGSGGAGRSSGASRGGGRSNNRGGERRRNGETGDGERRPAATSTPTATNVADDQGARMNDDRPTFEPPGEPVAIADVQAAAESFMQGLATAFGYEATVSSRVEDNEIEVRVDGDSLGLLIGPGGRTLLSIQDLARVAAQRRLGDHDSRLRVDVAGYREKRRVALERFAATVAHQVRETGVARSLDPMPSADRKVLHDALSAIDGVTSRSEGEEPNRRIVVVPG